MWKVLNREVDLGEPTSFLDHVYLVCTQRQCEISKDIVDNYRTMFESRNSARATEKLPYFENLSISSWSYDMESHAKKCVGDIVNWQTRRLNNSTKYLLHASMTTTSKKKKWHLLENWHKYALKLFWNAYTWHLLEDLIFLWSVNKLARSITKWTKPCDKRLNRLNSYIHHTCEYKQYCNVGNTAKQCRLGLFQEFDYARDLEDSKSTSGRTLCIFGKSYICSNKLNVQETNCCFTQFNRIRNHLFGRWIEIGRESCSRFVGSDRRSSQVYQIDDMRCSWLRISIHSGKDGGCSNIDDLVVLFLDGHPLAGPLWER